MHVVECFLRTLVVPCSEKKGVAEKEFGRLPSQVEGLEFPGTLNNPFFCWMFDDLGVSKNRGT